MSLHATENVEDAIAATKALLWPFEGRQWLELAVVAFFVGGVGAAAPPLQGGVSGDPDVGFGAFPEFAGLVIALAVVAVLLALAFALVGSVLEFSLVESLSTEDVRVREYARDHLRQGLQLFGFRVLLTLVVAALVAATVGVFLVGLLGDPARILFVLLALPVLLAVFVVAAVVHGFTTVLVVPIMVHADCGVLDGWRRLWPVVRAESTEYLVYLVLSVALSWVGGSLVGGVMAVFATILLVPFGVFGFLAFFVSGASALSLLVLVPLAVVLGVTLLAIGAAVRVPVLVYLRYYALLQLGDTSEYDLVSERRAEIRGE